MSIDGIHTRHFVFVSAVFAATFILASVSHAQQTPTESYDVASLEAEILQPVPSPSAPEVETESHVTPESRNTDSRHTGVLFLQLRQFAGAGINRGALHATSLEFGGELPTPTPYLSFQVGALVGYGALRDVVTRTPLRYFEMGFLADTIVRLNVTGPARLFIVSGARLTLGAPLDHADPEDECRLALATIEGSLGFGSEMSFARQGRLSLSVRGVRRRSIGQLAFAAGGQNLGISSSRAAWGITATVQVGTYLDL